MQRAYSSRARWSRRTNTRAVRGAASLKYMESPSIVRPSNGRGPSWPEPASARTADPLDDERPQRQRPRKRQRHGVETDLVVARLIVERAGQGERGLSPKRRLRLLVSLDHHVEQQRKRF